MNHTIYTYNGFNIAFQPKDSSVMVNATEMARPFAKRPSKWLELPSSKEFLRELSNVRKSDNWILTERGQHTGGTWMHEDVALEFARWLSPAFAIWCNDRIKELLKYGITATQPTLENIISNPEFGIQLLTELAKERAEKEKLQAANAKLQTRSDFLDVVFDANDLITMSQTAKILKLPYGRNTMLRKLREGGVLFKNSNEPYQHWVDKGYFVVKEQRVPRENHPPKIVLQTFPTQKGLAFIAKKLGVVTVPEDTKARFTTS